MGLFSKQTDVAVLDIGSGKLSVMIGKKTKDGFIVTVQSECRYDGFIDGEWVDEDKLPDRFSTVITQAERIYGKKIKELYVGVPGGFTSVNACEATVTSKFKKKFDKADVAEILTKANIHKDDARYKAINRSPVYYVVNDQKKVVDPVGCVGTKLTGLVSHIYADVRFLNKVTEILNRLGIFKIEFVSSCLAESWFLFDYTARDNYVLLVDIGYITTNVMLVCGDGLIYLKTFALGSGFLYSDLAQVLDIDYSSAESLKTLLNLNLEFDSDDTYALKNGQTVNAEKANFVVKARLEEIAFYISRCISLCPYPVDPETKLYLTGGGIAFLKGGVEYLSYCLNKRVKRAHSNNPLADKPQYSTAYGLVDIALKQL